MTRTSSGMGMAQAGSRSIRGRCTQPIGEEADASAGALDVERSPRTARRPLGGPGAGRPPRRARRAPGRPAARTPPGGGVLRGAARRLRRPRAGRGRARAARDRRAARHRRRRAAPTRAPSGRSSPSARRSSRTPPRSARRSAAPRCCRSSSGAVALVVRGPAQVADRRVRGLRARGRVGDLPRHVARGAARAARRQAARGPARRRQLPVRPHGGVDRGLRRASCC